MVYINSMLQLYHYTIEYGDTLHYYCYNLVSINKKREKRHKTDVLNLKNAAAMVGLPKKRDEKLENNTKERGITKFAVDV